MNGRVESSSAVPLFGVVEFFEGLFNALTRVWDFLFALL
jgi:hypothetical protein